MMRSLIMQEKKWEEPRSRGEEEGRRPGWFRKHNREAYQRGVQFGYCRLGTPLNHLYCDYYRRLIGRYLMSIYFTGLYLTGVYLMDMHLRDVSHIHVPYRRVYHEYVSHRHAFISIYLMDGVSYGACISQACMMSACLIGVGLWSCLMSVCLVGVCLTIVYRTCIS
jgi:hypothetical protein